MRRLLHGAPAGFRPTLRSRPRDAGTRRSRDGGGDFKTLFVISGKAYEGSGGALRSVHVKSHWAEKASFALDTQGAIHEPMDDGMTLDGGVRARMREEDAVRPH
ncbi:MAG: hypothetical protein KA105_00085 [Caulobacter sp.]|nr:hypothetical protein [Caulobacter sp.]